jgi:hypothetical protein
MYNQSTSHVRYHFRHCLNTSRTTGYEPGVAELLIRLPTSPHLNAFSKATVKLSTLSTATAESSHLAFFTHLTPSQKASTSEVFQKILSANLFANLH